MIIWGNEKLTRLEELYKAGVSITNIGRTMSVEFKEPISRNAVISKASREGITAKYPREAALTRNGEMSSYSAAAHHVHELAEEGLLPPFEKDLPAGKPKKKRRRRTKAQILAEARIGAWRGDGDVLPPAHERPPEQQPQPELNEEEIPEGRHHFTADMQCTWPQVASTDAIRCEAACQPGHPYCAPHVRRAYKFFGRKGADPQALLPQQHTPQMVMRHGRNGGFR